MDIYCLGFAGIPLSPEALKVLFFGAQAMFDGSERKKRVNFPFVTGEIKTDFQAGVLGSVSGYLFHADIDTPRGSTNVRYLVRQADFGKISPESFSFSCSREEDPSGRVTGLN